jgi:hypothetical protein
LLSGWLQKYEGEISGGHVLLLIYASADCLVNIAIPQSYREAV